MCDPQIESMYSNAEVVLVEILRWSCRDIPGVQIAMMSLNFDSKKKSKISLKTLQDYLNAKEKLVDAHKIT